MSSIYEAKEWTNLWWDEADKDEGLPRVLLIGDSQTFGFFPCVMEEMKDEIRVTALTTSKNVDNPYLIREIDCVASQFELKYDIIHFNSGLHGVHQTNVEEFAQDYEKIVRHLMETYPESKITLCLCPPCYQGENFQEPHEPLYHLAEERNAEVVKIAEKYGLPVDDLFTPMLEHRDMHVPDGIHYEENGRRLLGHLVSDFIRANL